MITVKHRIVIFYLKNLPEIPHYIQKLNRFRKHSLLFVVLIEVKKIQIYKLNIKLILHHLQQKYSMPHKFLDFLLFQIFQSSLYMYLLKIIVELHLRHLILLVNLGFINHSSNYLLYFHYYNLNLMLKENFSAIFDLILQIYLFN